MSTSGGSEGEGEGDDNGMGWDDDSYGMVDTYGDDFDEDGGGGGNDGIEYDYDEVAAVASSIRKRQQWEKEDALDAQAEKMEKDEDEDVDVDGRKGEQLFWKTRDKSQWSREIIQLLHKASKQNDPNFYAELVRGFEEYHSYVNSVQSNELDEFEQTAFHQTVYTILQEAETQKEIQRTFLAQVTAVLLCKKKTMCRAETETFFNDRGEWCQMNIHFMDAMYHVQTTTTGETVKPIRVQMKMTEETGELVCLSVCCKNGSRWESVYGWIRDTRFHDGWLTPPSPEEWGGEDLEKLLIVCMFIVMKEMMILYDCDSGSSSSKGEGEGEGGGVGNLTLSFLWNEFQTHPNAKVNLLQDSFVGSK